MTPVYHCLVPDHGNSNFGIVIKPAVEITETYRPVFLQVSNMIAVIVVCVDKKPVVGFFCSGVDLFDDLKFYSLWITDCLFSI